MEFLAINILAGGAGWGIPVVLSDLTEACLFQRGKQAKDIIQMRFDTLEQVIWQLQVLYDSFWTGQCTGCWTLHASSQPKDSLCSSCLFAGICLYPVVVG